MDSSFFLFDILVVGKAFDSCGKLTGLIILRPPVLTKHHLQASFFAFFSDGRTRCTMDWMMMVDTGLGRRDIY